VHPITESLVVDAPAAAVWAVVADYTRDAEWRTGVLEMRPEPAGEVRSGTTTHEVIRLGGRTYRNRGLVTRALPGARLEWRTTAGAQASGSRTVEARGDDRCEVTLELCVVPHGLERLLAPVLRRMLVRNLRGDLVRLAGIVQERTSDRTCPSTA
jgi:hypothetical protein